MLVSGTWETCSGESPVQSQPGGVQREWEQQQENERRRMDFSIRCAYAHGTCALRTHLINMVPKQLELTWPAFDRLRKKWKGKVRSTVPSPA